MVQTNSEIGGTHHSRNRWYTSIPKYLVQTITEIDGQSIPEYSLRLPKVFFESRKTGELVARLNDTRRVQTVLSIVFSSIMVDSLVILVSIAFMFTYSMLVGFIVLGIVPLYFSILFLFNQRIIDAQREVMSGYAIAESNFVDTIQGVTDIKLSNKQGFFEKLNSSIYGLFQQKVANLGRLNTYLSLFSELTSVIFLLTILGVSAYLVLSNDLKLGGLVALVSLSTGVIPSVYRIMMAHIQIQEAIVAFDRMFEFASIEKEFEESATTIADIDEISVDNLSFQFADRSQLFKGISFKIKKGQLAALVGESGSGKSTLLQILQKFYIPESCNILIDKTRLETINSSNWRDLVSSVPQDAKIFNGSLLFNLTLSDQPEDYQNAFSFCEEMGFGKYFAQFPQGYLTLLGESGINISGGQKQLVTLARALLRNPKILLLDEATSSMDPIAENFVLSLLQKEKSKMIILLVTHRISPSQQCDVLYRLENGTIHQVKT